MNAISYYVFGEARHGALLGNDGWLFSQEEFGWGRRSAINYQAAAHLIGKVVLALHSHGSKVALLPLPLKADLYEEQLGRYRAPFQALHVYEAALSAFSASGAEYVVDVRRVLLEGRSRHDVFLRTDTHWTVEGAGDVADALCDQAAAELPHSDKGLVPQRSVQHRGDLLNFFDLGPFSSSTLAQTDVVTPLLASTPATDESALFSDVEGFPVALVGTSYSADPMWSFRDQLEAHCRASVLNISEKGEGPFEPMTAYLNKLGRGDVAPAQLVVWEIPVRYLDDYTPADLDALGTVQ